MDFLLTLQALRTPFWDTVMVALSYLGEELIPFFLMMLFFWCIDKKIGLRVGFSMFGVSVLGQTLKLICVIERPWVLDSRVVPMQEVLPGATGYSFPSGHTFSFTSLVAALCSFYKKWWLWLSGLVLAVGLAFSRMYTGVHTPLDVGMALALGLFGGLGMCYIADTLDKPGRAKLYAILGLAVTTAMAAFAMLRVASGVVPAAQAADVMKLAGTGYGMILGLFLERRYVRFTTQAKPWQQVVKLLVGLAATLAIKEGLKLLFGDVLLLHTLRYFLSVLFVVAGYPALFMRVLKPSTKEAK